MRLQNNQQCGIRLLKFLNKDLKCHLNWILKTKKVYFFEPVSQDPDIYITLVSPETIEKKCGLPSNLSCAELGGRYLYLNSDRWFNGSKESKLSLEDYRQYMVSHEIGHILGHEHVKCPCVGCKAPIMMQQTLGIGKCQPNTNV